MADSSRSPASPIGRPPLSRAGLQVTDVSELPKWRFWADAYGVAVGHCRRDGERLVLAVAPGEWIAVGGRPPGESVDLTHVRAAVRVGGRRAVEVLATVCALDFDDRMFPAGAAGRSLVAGVAAEIARDDEDGLPSYLLLMSRSFARSVWLRIAEAAG